jgi:hypothetical protein
MEKRMQCEYGSGIVGFVGFVEFLEFIRNPTNPINSRNPITHNATLYKILTKPAIILRYVPQTPSRHTKKHAVDYGESRCANAEYCLYSDSSGCPPRGKIAACTHAGSNTLENDPAAADGKRNHRSS